MGKNSSANLLPSWDVGRYPLDQYRGEFLASLDRAFLKPMPSGRYADFIIIDGHSGPCLFACTQWALAEGLIVYDDVTSEMHSDEQWASLCYRLTDKGREMISPDDGGRYGTVDGH